MYCTEACHTVEYFEFGDHCHGIALSLVNIVTKFGYPKTVDHINSNESASLAGMEYLYWYLYLTRVLFFQYSAVLIT